MVQLKGSVAIVTGASAGIGAGITRGLVEAGMTVVGIARRSERVLKLAEELKGSGSSSDGKLYALKADLTKEEDILNAFKWTSENVGPVSVLINNAGIHESTSLTDGDTQKWKNVLDTNVLAVAIASREAIKIMTANQIDGHIININSTAGHQVPTKPDINFNVYPASKFALTALTETLRLELIRLGSKIKVTNLSPGYVRTEIGQTSDAAVRNESPVMKFLSAIRPLETEDISSAVLYILGTPPHVQVTELIIKPVTQDF